MIRWIDLMPVRERGRREITVGAPHRAADWTTGPGGRAKTLPLRLHQARRRPPQDRPHACQMTIGLKKSIRIVYS